MLLYRVTLRLLACFALASMSALCSATDSPESSPQKTKDSDIQFQIKELDRRLKAALASHDLVAMVQIRQDHVKLVEEVAGPESPQLASALNSLAGVYRDQSRLDLALPILERALSIREKVLGVDHQETVVLVNNLAMAYEDLGRFDLALALNQRALAIREKKLGTDSLEYAGSLNNLATLYLRMGRLGEAQAGAERSQAIIEKLNGADSPLTATSLNNLASILEKIGLYEKAMPLYERALAIREKRFGPDHIETVASLNNIAGLYRQMGLFDKAVPLLERSLTVNEKVLGKDHPVVAMACNNLAELYKVVGRYDKALPLYQRALAIVEHTLGPEHETTASCLNNLAGMYLALGSLNQVEPLLVQSLAINEKRFGSDHPKVAQALNNLAMFYRKQKQYDRALPLQERATAIKRKSAGMDHPETAIALGNLAGLYDEVKRYDDALKLFEQSLSIMEKALGPDHPQVGMALANLASHYRHQDDFNHALSLYQRGLRIATLSHYPELMREMLGHLRRTYSSLKQPAVAIFFGKQAVNTMQAMRGQSVGLTKDLQQSLLKSNVEHYRALADLLIETGRLAEAQQVLAMLKEEEFFEFIRRDVPADPRTTRVLWTPAETGFATKFERIGNTASGLANEKRVLDLRTRLGSSQTDQARLAILHDQLLELGRQNDALLTELTEQLPIAQQRFANEEQRNNNRLTSEVRSQIARLGEDVAMLHYLVLGDRIRIMLTTRDKLIARETVMPEADLLHLLIEFRLAVQDPDGKPEKFARQLYNQLIEPVTTDLEAAKVRHLLLSLDGVLRYIPFAALQDGSTYLIERYALTLHTAAGKSYGASQAHWQVAGFGLTRAIGENPALPSVADELHGIIGPNGIAGQAKFDEEFTAAALEKALVGPYSVVHLASHFRFTPGNEADSFLLLGDGNHLSLRELREATYSFDSLDLLTLSACETAMFGGREADGREVEGFSVLAQRKGAKGVLATLWPIADNSTAKLMQSFYHIREQMGLSKAEALRQAQLELLRGSRDKGYEHPFYWAAFILMGNGK